MVTRARRWYCSKSPSRLSASSASTPSDAALGPVMRPFRPLLLCAVLAATAVAATGPALAQPRQARVPTQPQPPAAPSNAEKIVAVVNGDAITSGDVEARGRLFALSTGLPVTPEVLDRLRPQVTKQLIDERLRLQEVQRRKVIVNDRDIAEAIG